MLVVRVTENVRAVQSSYYSSCPCAERLSSWTALSTSPLNAAGSCQRLLKKLLLHHHLSRLYYSGRTRRHFLLPEKFRLGFSFSFTTRAETLFTSRTETFLQLQPLSFQDLDETLHLYSTQWMRMPSAARPSTGSA
jgi:hypothetical protein